MNSKPQVSDEEIRSFMDFDVLLQRRNAELHKRQLLLKTGLGVLVLAVITSVFFLFPESGKNISRVAPASDSAVLKSESIDVSPKLDSPAVVQGKNTEKDIASVGADAPQQKATVKAESTEPTIEKETSAQEEHIYVQAEPVDGYENLFSYFRENLAYPSAALNDSIQGVMKVSFVIDVDGKPRHIRVEESLGPLFEEEALKLINAMPPWTPALLNGKPVKSRISLPITFDIRKVE